MENNKNKKIKKAVSTKIIEEIIKHEANYLKDAKFVVVDDKTYEKLKKEIIENFGAKEEDFEGITLAIEKIPVYAAFRNKKKTFILIG